MEKRKMNKKASFNFSSFINAALIMAVLYFVIFFVFGASGGFTAISNAGAFASKVPGWAWIGIAIFVLLSMVGGKK